MALSRWLAIKAMADYGFTLFERELMMNKSEGKVRTLEEALQEPRKHRDMNLALQPMDNHRSTPDGPNKQPLNSYLDEKLKAAGIDTIVLAGLWTDECILSTAYAGNSRGYDVVVVGDAVATATANQEIALKVASSTVANVLPTDELISYMKNDFITGESGAVKGISHPDGRKEG